MPLRRIYLTPPILAKVVNLKRSIEDQEICQPSPVDYTQFDERTIMHIPEDIFMQQGKAPFSRPNQQSEIDFG